MAVDFGGAWQAWQVFFDHVEKWAQESEASIELLPERIVYRYNSLEEMETRFGESPWRDCNPWADDSENDGSDEIVELDASSSSTARLEPSSFATSCRPTSLGSCGPSSSVQVLQYGGFGGAEMKKYADAAHVYVEGDPVEPIIIPDHAPDDADRWFQIAKLASASKEMRAISSGALTQLKKLHTKLGTQSKRIDEWRYDVGARMTRSIKHASIDASTDDNKQVPLPDGDFTFAFVTERDFEDANVWLCDLQNARCFNTRWHDMGIQYEAGNQTGYENVLHFDLDDVAKRPDATVVYVRKLGRKLKQIKTEYWTNHTISKDDVLTMLDDAPWSAQ